MSKLIHEELSRSIIAAAMGVLNEMKPGLDEKLYERAMVIELKKRRHAIEVQKQFPVFYQAELIGYLIPDLIVDGTVIVDPKVVASFDEAHVAQMVGYLAITSLELALLLNFKTARLNGSASSGKRSWTPRHPISMLNLFYPLYPRDPRFSYG
jgi:GxxExxY protein